MTEMSGDREWPRVRSIGTEALLVSFGERLSDGANRAALAFRSAVDEAKIDGVTETSTSLVSAYVGFDETVTDPKDLAATLATLAASRDWFSAPLPPGRKLWRIPTVFGGPLAPQLDEAAEAAGLSEADAVRSLTGRPVRVQTIGFAPGQPYLGELGPEWDIPRQTDLTPKVPEGALVVAIRQLVLFSVTTPTGWRHVGQTAFRAFRPDGDRPFVLQAGDEVLFDPVHEEELERCRAQGADGGATFEELA